MTSLITVQDVRDTAPYTKGNNKAQKKQIYLVKKFKQ
jgi:hypothetical protein